MRGARLGQRRAVAPQQAGGGPHGVGVQTRCSRRLRDPTRASRQSTRRSKSTLEDSCGVPLATTPSASSAARSRRSWPQRGSRLTQVAGPESGGSCLIGGPVLAIATVCLNLVRSSASAESIEKKADRVDTQLEALELQLDLNEIPLARREWSCIRRPGGSPAGHSEGGSLQSGVREGGAPPSQAAFECSPAALSGGLHAATRNLTGPVEGWKDVDLAEDS